METTTIAIDTTQAEQNLVNLTAKVELLTARLKELTAVFKEAETALSTLDAQEIAGTELQTSKPQLVITMPWMEVLRAPVAGFTPEFNEQISEAFKGILTPKMKEAEPTKSAIVKPLFEA